jgi:hypothetical protein
VAQGFTRKRLWKLSEIEQMNPGGQDLFPTLFEGS